jgi:acetyl esterase/lipase
VALRWATLLSALALGGCSATGTLGALTTSPQVEHVADLAYAPGPRHGVDVYRPRDGGPHPVAIFFYGGSWQEGARAEYRFVGQSLAAQGVLTIIPDYRLYPDVVYPAFLADSAQAVRWAVEHAAAFGGDAQQLFLIGHSAGAYNAAMLALDPQWLRSVGLEPRRDVRGMIGIAGPYDFLPLRSDDLKAIFGPESTRAQTQPIHHVDGSPPPLLLLTDGSDKVVDPGNTQRLAAKVQAAEGEARAVVYPGLSHALVLGALAKPFGFLAPVRRDVLAFIVSRSKDGAP